MCQCTELCSGLRLKYMIVKYNINAVNTPIPIAESVIPVTSLVRIPAMNRSMGIASRNMMAFHAPPRPGDTVTF